MKVINEYINEALLTEASKDPKVGTVAYDYYGQEWTIKAAAKTSNKSDVESLCNEYDESGAMTEMLEDYNSLKKDYKWVVGVESEEFGNAAYVWGDDGVCYENK